jgi:hypothetical protein
MISGVDRFRHPAGHRHVLGRVDLPAQPFRVMLGQLLAQRRVPPRRRILIVAVQNSPRRRLFHFLRCIEVREALAQVDGLVLHGQPGHLADDGLSETGNTLGSLHSSPPCRAICLGNGSWVIMHSIARSVNFKAWIIRIWRMSETAVE